MQQNSRDFRTYSILELKESAKLLIMYRSDSDKTRLLSHPVSVELNPESKTVFLVDDDFHTAVVRGSILEDWLVCGCLNEGFRDHMLQGKSCCKNLALLKLDQF